ncbi:MAG: putative Peptidase rane alanine aminopeptidase [Acidimicrobiia bacterium]|nr:putative Peptidase rane alanine aminopeptidase [Acidimicrobiia bacterium]
MTLPDPYRLPRSAVPRRYVIELEPDLEAATFAGSVAIELDVTEPSRELVCNVAEIEIDEAYVVDHAGGRHEASTTVDPELERVAFTVDQPLSGAVTLHVRFRGVLNDLLRGFYRSTFVDDNGQQSVIATTQMQATDARRAFPCWDEPELKATFSVALVVDESLVAISNGPETGRTTRADGKHVVQFAETMVMSTYLVAFVVGPLEITDAPAVRGIPLRVVHVPGKGHLTDFAIRCATAALEFYVDYYGIPYPSDKVDLVAMPDFAAGAMENLGCITFRESLLLVDPDTATTNERRVVADVVCHELAHMWFGDLVTMRWWNGIWLNEAFATFMEVMACDHWRPDWHRWEHFSLERAGAFEVDSLTTTRPIELEVNSPDDASAMFDVLTYEKGGALLRMLEQYLGQDRFRDGIRHYLAAHAYGNTETSDLWDAIEEVTGEPVRRIMDTWIWQGGYPLISAARNEQGQLVLRQQRFGYRATEPRTWAVPVQVRAVAADADDVTKVLLDTDEVTLDQRFDGALVANAGGHGFYRVHYSPELLAQLTGPSLAQLAPIERHGLVDDFWAAVVAGASDAAGFCDLARSFGDETELAVWQVLVSGLGWCDRFIPEANRNAFCGFVRALVGPVLARLGLEVRPDDSELIRQLRGLLFQTQAVLGADVTLVERARQLLGDDKTDPALVAAATVVVANNGTDADYDQFVDDFERAATPQEQLRSLYALAEFPDEAQMVRTLELAVSDRVRSQNAPFLLNLCLSSRRHGPLVWDFVSDRWDELASRFPKNTHVRMLEGVQRLIQPQQQAAVATFFEQHPIGHDELRLRQILERQAVNVDLAQRAAPGLAAHFS